MQRHLQTLCFATCFLLTAACGDIVAPDVDGDGGAEDASTHAPKLTALTPTQGTTAGGTLVALSGSGFFPGMLPTFGGEPATEVTVHSPTVMTAKTPAHAAGKIDVVLLGAPGGNASLSDGFEYVAPTSKADADGRPRVVGAISTSNTSVRVTFTEAVDTAAEDSSNYVIVQANVNPESGALAVRGAKLDASGVSVTLTTASQNEVTYALVVSNVRDVDGNPLAPPELLVNPTTVQFAGTPAGAIVDSDGDGVSDAAEQSGWTVTVALSNGDLAQATHTSDPTQADTDGDGLKDGEEYAQGSNARAPDTDGDGVSDVEEVNDWRSSPTTQDTDGDGFLDGVELTFETSPILADTDGDGESDRSELLLLSRDPLIANLPVPQIVVQSVSLQLDVKSSYTDEHGQSHSISDSTSSAFTQSRSQTESRSDTRSTESSNKNSQEVGVELSYGTKDGFGGKINGKVGFEQASARGFSSTVDSESATASQQAYARSITDALETSERRSVTRSIERAAILANVNLANQSNVAFTVKNLQISVQQQDRGGDGSFRPVATLVPSGGDLSFNLGPFDSERGPVIFENTDIFPNLVEDLAREPTGLVFKVANFDVVDEQGRNFAFSNAVTNQRTVGVSVDYGDGTVEAYRIATHAKFDARGRPQGITLQRALEIAGLAFTPNDTALPTTPTAAQLASYGTLRDSMGVERLVRVRGAQNDLASTSNPEKRFWAIQTNNTKIAPDSDFSSVVVRAGDEYLLYFTRDVDRDGLHEREEMLYGSLDTKPDTDSDGLPDLDEVRKGWSVAPLPGQVYKVFSSPARPDSDRDLLTDLEERAYGTDPNRGDTDSDALFDTEELTGEFQISLFDGDPDDTNNPRLSIDPYSDDSIVEGGNGTCNTSASGDDVQLVALGAGATTGTALIGPGPNGVIDTLPTGDDLRAQVEHIAVGPDGACSTIALGDDVTLTVPGSGVSSNAACIGPGANGVIDSVATDDDFVRVVHESLYTTHPTRQDTDFDGIPDGRELLIGTNPNAQDVGNITDTDNDGLYDAEEDNGWYVAAAGGVVKSNKRFADTDQDGLLDVYEWAIGSNPANVDTDGDTLRDGEEFDPDDTDGYYSVSNLVTADTRCSNATNCMPAAPPPLVDRLRCNVLSNDSDNDTLHDDFEVDAGKPGSSVWTVSVVGKTPYSAVPKPWSADFDLDNVRDAVEYADKTDPNLADTDNDTLTALVGDDGHEKNVGRNPLEADQKVTAKYLTLYQANTCGESGEAEWYGSVYITTPNGTQTLRATCNDCIHSSSSGSWDTGDTGTTFLLAQGKSFTLSSDRWSEDDTTGDDDVGAFSSTLSYSVSATPGTSLAITGGDADCASSLTVTYSITLQ